MHLVVHTGNVAPDDNQSVTVPEWDSAGQRIEATFMRHRAAESGIARISAWV